MPNAKQRPPVVAIVGRKHSGKTTLLVRLAAELGARGHRVMTVKHGTHTFNIDPATTDTYRHYHEGNAAKVAMVAPDKFALIERHDAEPTLDSVIDRHLSDADIVLAEGFTRSALPKIEIFRRAAHAEPRIAFDSEAFRHVRAIVTDDADLQLPVATFSLTAPDWLARLATLVESDFLSES